MGTSKLSFRILLAITCAVSILLLAAVGCTSATPTSTATPLPTDPCAELYSGDPLEFPEDLYTHSLEVTPRAAGYGETLVIKQTLRNISDQKLRVVLASGIPNGFLVTKTNGDYVIDSFCPIVALGPQSSYHLEPGEVKEFTHKWDQKRRGEPIPPGIYLVRGLLMGAEGIRMAWRTKAVKVEILPEPRPEPTPTVSYAGSDEDDYQCEGPPWSKFDSHTRKVRWAYFRLLWSYPNAVLVYTGELFDKNKKRLHRRGIIVHLSEEVDPETLPPEDRLPRCLEGVPIQIKAIKASGDIGDLALEPTPAPVPPQIHYCAGLFSEAPLEPREDFTHSLEVTPTDRLVAYGETVVIKQTIRNVSDQRLQLVLARGIPSGFLVTKTNGDYVMDSFCPVFGHAITDSYHLEPGWVEEFTHEWDQTDIWGQHVPPNVYLVWGLLMGAEGIRMAWKTEPVAVKVLPKDRIPKEMNKCRAESSEYIHEVRLKYDDLFWRQPHVEAVGEGSFKDENGEWVPIVGIVVHVYEVVDQETLPPEDRIPRCLEGVPVQIRVDEWGDLGDAIGIPNDERRPHVSGIRIESARASIANVDNRGITGGTLTGLATRTKGSA